MQTPVDDTTEESPSKAQADPKPSRLGPLQAMGWLFVAGLLLLGIIAGAIAYRIIAPTPEPEQIVETIETGPDVVVAIRDLARLETASYHVERVIDLRQQQNRFFGLVDAEDALLLVAAADVTAGIDLTELRDGDIVVDPDQHIATITLPAPQIFSAALDNERTYVHTRDTDLLAARDDHLETRARREAERSLQESAIEAGILDRARANGETAVRTLVRSLGYDHITIQWRDQPQPELERAAP
ncbi:MAG: DUF4230 domain-containing protein [Myxococcota bacterium]